MPNLFTGLYHLPSAVLRALFLQTQRCVSHSLRTIQRTLVGQSPTAVGVYPMVYCGPSVKFDAKTTGLSTASDTVSALSLFVFGRP